MRLVFDSVKEMLDAYTTLFGKDSKVRHAVMISDDGIVALQKTVVSDIISFLCEAGTKISKDEMKKIEDLAKNKRMQIIKCKRIEFDERKEPLTVKSLNE